MMSGNRRWILPGDDPEALAIRDLLTECGEDFRHALDAEGCGVTPRTAYHADVPDLEGVETIYRVECSWPGADVDPRVVVIDHHNEGDPGFGLPPDLFLEASSLGQVIAVLAADALPPEARRSSEPGVRGWNAVIVGRGYGVGTFGLHANGFWWVATQWPGSGLMIPTDLVLTAAADHCLAAAYRNRCPGVTRCDIEEFRVRQLCHASRASSRGETRTEDQVRESIRRAKDALLTAPVIRLSDGVPEGPIGRNYEVRDCRGPMIPDLPEAAMILGLGYLAGGVPLREGDRAKVVVGGCGFGSAPGMYPVEAFLGGWAQANGLTGIYGDPTRGFAGGYLPA